MIQRMLKGIKTISTSKESVKCTEKTGWSGRLSHGDRYMIVGLGNPGAKYAQTRHNIGFRTIDVLIDSLHAPSGRHKKNGVVYECRFENYKVVLVKPLTFMNLSGKCVAALACFYKIIPERLLVIYDDIDLLEGQLRVRARGSAGSHNGMRSIIGEFGQSDFPRIRIGIGPKEVEYSLSDWVLSEPMMLSSRENIRMACRNAADCAMTWLSCGIEEAMRLFNNKHSTEVH